jgi:hypothetical protein
LDHYFTVTVVADGPVEAIAELVSPFAGVGRPRDNVDVTSYEIAIASQLGFRLVVDDYHLVEDSNAWHVMAMLQWHLNQAVVAASSRSRVLLHAAAAVQDDVSVVLAAPMENGKTTTVTGLVRAGFGYLTDETVAIDPDTHRIAAYPKALTIDQGSWPLFPDLRVPPIGPADASWYVPVERIREGAQLAEAEAPSLLIFPAYRPGAQTALIPLSASEAVLDLVRSTFRFEEAPERNLAVLAAVARSGAAYRLDIGDLDQAVSLVKELVEMVDVS